MPNKVHIYILDMCHLYTSIATKSTCRLYMI